MHSIVTISLSVNISGNTFLEEMCQVVFFHCLISNRVSHALIICKMQKQDTIIHLNRKMAMNFWTKPYTEQWKLINSQLISNRDFTGNESIVVELGSFHCFFQGPKESALMVMTVLLFCTKPFIIMLHNVTQQKNVIFYYYWL